MVLMKALALLSAQFRLERYGYHVVAGYQVHCLLDSMAGDYFGNPFFDDRLLSENSFSVVWPDESV